MKQEVISSLLNLPSKNRVKSGKKWYNKGVLIPHLVYCSINS